MSGDIDLKQLHRQITMAREDMETWPEWMRQAAQTGAALPPDVLSVADEVIRLHEENEKLRAAPKWWHCDTHGPATADAWGCPECVRAMRDEIKRLRDVLDAWSQDGRLQSYNDRERFREAARSVLADA